VLRAIENSGLSLNGRNVILSSGASNDTSQLAMVSKQIAALQRLGAQVTLAGVGEGVENFREVNKQLAMIAKGAGIAFTLGAETKTGALEGTEGARVHPRSYEDVLRDISRQIALAQSGPRAGATQPVPGATDNSIENNVSVGTVHVHTQATNAYEVGGAMKGALRDNMVFQSNTGLE
jgi:hypothetical protein